MGVYLSVIDDEGNPVINRIKLLYVGRIWEDILYDKGMLKDGIGSVMEFDKEYPLSNEDIRRASEYYTDIIDDIPNRSWKAIIYNNFIVPLENEISETDKTYIVKVE